MVNRIEKNESECEYVTHGTVRKGKPREKEKRKYEGICILSIDDGHANPRLDTLPFKNLRDGSKECREKEREREKYRVREASDEDD